MDASVVVEECPAGREGGLGGGRQGCNGEEKRQQKRDAADRHQETLNPNLEYPARVEDDFAGANTGSWRGQHRDVDCWIAFKKQHIGGCTLGERAQTQVAISGGARGVDSSRVRPGHSG